MIPKGPILKNNHAPVQITQKTVNEKDIFCSLEKDIFAIHHQLCKGNYHLNK